MKTVGIIAEYNPFHNGHLHHIKKARELSGADYAAVVMSGDFTERGTPAVFSKALRTKLALLGGADLVFELPVFGALAPAQDFAMAGVSALHASGIVDTLCFGSECGDIGSLSRQQKELSEEPPEVSEKIQEFLRQGMSWPRARAEAYSSFSTVPLSPNDILGVEYLGALKRLSSPIVPFTIPRKDPGYHSLSRSGSFASASAIRNALLLGDQDFLDPVLPDFFFPCLKESGEEPLWPDDFSFLLNEKILSASIEDLEQTAGMPKDMAASLFRDRLTFRSVTEITAAQKTRQYTYARTSRSLANVMLSISREDSLAFKAAKSAPWLRVLGFKKSAAPLLAKLNEKAAVPVITKTAAAPSLLSKETCALFEKHLKSAELRRLTAQLKTGRTEKNEFTRPLTIL